MLILEDPAKCGYHEEFQKCPVCSYPVKYIKVQYDNNSIHYRCECLSPFCGWYQNVKHCENASIDRHRQRTLNAWAKKVKERDGYQCRECGSRENLHAHHLLPKAEYPDFQYDIENGVTLCLECHEKIHSWMKGKYYDR